MKPVLLLDIDGVINAATRIKFPQGTWPKADWIDTSAEPAADRRYRILTARPVVDFFNDLDEQGLVEIRWHTTWQQSAARVAEVVGLRDFAVADAPEFSADTWNGADRGPNYWWKLPAAERVLTEEQRPLIWVDDDINYSLTVGLRRQLRAAGRVLLVCPNTGQGLHAKELDAIRKFLELLAVERKEHRSRD